MPAPYLLHSLADLREVVLPVLEIVDARVVVEIGSEEGLFTREVAQWVGDREGRLICIDPAPAEEMRAFAAEVPAVDLIEAPSLEVLPTLGPADVYLVDGDHNYYTVRHELDAIAARPGDRPWVALLHDVGWPCGRRDMYYDPDSIPADARHPYTYDLGITLDRHEAGPGGFTGGGEMAIALHEGGPKNGVMTAVEDFMSESGAGLELAMIAPVFGLAVLFPPDAPWATELRAHLTPLQGNGLLERLERNRLELYLRVLELDNLAASTLAEVARAPGHGQDYVAENRALWARIDELERALEQATTEAHTRAQRQQAAEHALRSLLSSGTFGLAERLSRLRHFGRPTAVSRAEIAALVDGEPQP